MRVVACQTVVPVDRCVASVLECFLTAVYDAVDAY